MSELREISIASRAELIRHDWAAYDLSSYSDAQLVAVWNEWFMTNEENDSLQSFIDELFESVGDNI